MKKLIVLNLLLALSLMGYAQNTEPLKTTIQKDAEKIGQGGSNELKFNLLNAVIGMPEISYERLLADNMGIGASVFAALDNDVQYKFAFTPYYRIYFGSKKASGFFIEGSGNITTIRDDYTNYDFLAYTSVPPGYFSVDRETNETHFGLGAAVGAKFLTRNGFLGEIYAGANRLLSQKSSYVGDAYPRIGITIGKRF